MTCKLLLVGEAWGMREELFEHALVGYSGWELAKMLREAGLAFDHDLNRPSELEMMKFWRTMRDDYGTEITNVFNLRPRDNNIELFFTSAQEGITTLPPIKRGKYLRPDMAHHLETLWATVERLQPNLIVAMGNTATWALLESTGISKIRGTVQRSVRHNIKVLPTFHPAAVLRQWNLRPIVVNDLQKASREAETKDITRIERWVTVNPTLAEISEWLNRPADFYAVDIENKPAFITMIGFARTPHDAMVIPFFDEDRPGGNYWDSVEDEMAAWHLVGRGLEAMVPKVFQNGIYDLSHLLRLGFRPTMCKDDTMLLHHALYPEMLKSLGFLGSIYSDEIAWKSMRGHGNNLKRDE